MAINGIFNPIDIAVSGLRAQGKQMEVISSNIANARTQKGDDGQPYKRLEAVFKSANDGISAVTVGGIAKDQSEYQRILDPGNPAADAQGYVAMPNVSLPKEMMDLTIASRAYQANAAVMKRYQKMAESSLELLR
jgi:flagellar basal-body rod protein FlgC